MRRAAKATERMSGPGHAFTSSAYKPKETQWQSAKVRETAGHFPTARGNLPF
jgi:hypothetical protein